MTRTEAAEIMGLDTRVWARRTGQPVTRDLVEERISEWRGPNYAGTRKGSAAQLASVRTTLRAALKG